MLGFPMFNPATPDVWKMNTPHFPFVTPGLFPASAPSSPTNVDAEVASSQQSEANKEKVGPMFPAREKPLSDTQKQIVRGPLDYLLKSPGKDIRRKFIHAFNEWLRIPEDKLNIITEIVGLLHTASLLIDDIQDNSKLRRGLPVAHSIFGIAQTINSANYAYFLAQERLRELNHPEAYEIYTEELLRLHRGQGMDLYWRDCLTCPTEEDYIEMIANKTGGLFRLAIKLMQLESETKSNVIELADLLGVIFQIRDDYQNLQSGLYTKNKGFCEDLTEGKFSFLIIHSINSNPNNHHLLNILRQRSEDDSVKKYAVEYIDSTGSFDYCRERLTSLLEEADQMVKKLENEAGQSKGIYDILSFLS